MEHDHSHIHAVGVHSIACLSYRNRAFRQDAVDVLAESMRERGLINPITLRPGDATGYLLIAGRHRLKAARKLDWETIPAVILDGLDAVEAELCEIDENLIRADLTPAERAAHHARRKELYELRHPETKHGGDRKSAARKSNPQNADLNRAENTDGNKSYTEDAATKTGKSRDTIERAVKRGKSISDVAGLAGTSLDKGAELDALAKLKEIAPECQAELIEKAKTGEKVSARAELASRTAAQKADAAQPTVPTPALLAETLPDIARQEFSHEPSDFSLAQQRMVIVTAIHGLVSLEKSIHVDFDLVSASMGDSERNLFLKQVCEAGNRLNLLKRALLQTDELNWPDDSFPDLVSISKDAESRHYAWLKMAPRVVGAITAAGWCYTNAGAYKNAIHNLTTIFDVAAGIEAYMLHAGDADSRRQALEIQWRVAGAGGTLLGAMKEAGHLDLGRAPEGVKIGTPSGSLSLGDLNFSGNRSANWQWVARLPEAEIRERIGKAMRPHPYPADRPPPPPEQQSEPAPEQEDVPEQPSPPTQMHQPQPVIETSTEQQRAECTAAGAEEAATENASPAMPAAESEVAAATPTVPARGAVDDGLDIPDFLRRSVNAPRLRQPDADAASLAPEQTHDSTDETAPQQADPVEPSPPPQRDRASEQRTEA